MRELYNLLRLVAMLIWRTNEQAKSVLPVVPSTLPRMPRCFVDHPPSAWAAP